ncbi:HAD-IA family hydrolase [Sphingobium nicotianae]|uniref:HAD-IA family hydrolase n=1 Tax=Sphingobium nicotianae TaxID=2782607 RepID=A0A9X1DG99_9SPHN|nr:HAD-IA family hydrolase [Sphingobium nicotianae]MBT2188913.1 HAD-IA family hydrolase [Sphingobium nicotianae]
MSLRLAIFDCDGTLVDSQHAIVAAMEHAFAAESVPPPSRAQILSIVGLSLQEAIARLAPEASPALVLAVREHYRTYNVRIRESGAAFDPLYDGIAPLLDRLVAEDWLLGVATGKSIRGLRHVLATHNLTSHFVTLQTADHHPSKPHPSMIETALAETGVDRANAVMIGDTSFDMMMAQAARVRALGVGWGYHPPGELFAAGAASVAMDSAELGRHIGLP